MLIQEYNPFLNRHPPGHTKAVRLIQARISFIWLEEYFRFGTIAVWASSVMHDLRIIVFQNKPNYLVYFDWQQFCLWPTGRVLAVVSDKIVR